MNISRYLARTLVNANLMSTRDYAQRYWWPDKPLDDAENCKRRSNNPSVKRPDCAAAPE